MIKLIRGSCLVAVVSALLVCMGCDVVGDDGGASEAVSYQLGDFEAGDTGPAGGIIFYVDTADNYDWIYLEGWTADEPGTYPWKVSQTSTAETAAIIDTGYQNTYVAMAGTHHPAAAAAREAVYGGYDDWFLPSKDELQQLYLRRAEVGGFASVYYWSSSEYDATDASGQNFSTGNQNNYNKGSNIQVRVVRAF